jgi:hypothetical protein
MSKTNEEPHPISEFKEEVITWDTDDLLKAVTAEGNLYTDNEMSSIESELRIRSIAVPLKCPICALINPLRTAECPACGHNFSEVAREIPAALEQQLCARCHLANDKRASECLLCGHALDSALQTTKMLRDNEGEIDALAKRALKGSLMCLLFPDFSLLLAPFAMNRAMDTLGALSELHKKYPDHAFKTSAKAKALTALLLGTLVFLLNVILVLYFVLSLSQSGGLAPDVW